MSGSPFLSLIEGLNSEDSSVPSTMPSPEDYAAELLLWTNAEFTFDMPPGLGIFESDSGFDGMLAANTASSTSQSAQLLPLYSHDQTLLGQHHAFLQQQQALQLSLQHPQPSMELLNLTTTTTTTTTTAQESRPLSLLERSRQRNPLTEDKTEFQQLDLQQHQHQQQQQQQEQLTGEPCSVLEKAIDISQIERIEQLSSPSTKDEGQDQGQARGHSKDSTKMVTNTSLDITTPISTDTALPVPETSSQLSNDIVEMDENFKVAAEDDKRRRNTAASARFRQKKKLREQALEQTAQEQTNRAEKLETRVRELEMEVRWLRGLIVEKDSRIHEATVNLNDANKRIRLQDPTSA